MQIIFGVVAILIGADGRVFKTVGQGILACQWVATDQGRGAWLSYAWAAPRLVEGFQIFWGVGLPDKWKVSALATNGVWQVVWRGETRPPDTFLAWIAPTKAKALRLDCLVPAMRSNTHAVREWRIWGQ
jgi:hypothetical protein